MYDQDSLPPRCVRVYVPKEGSHIRMDLTRGCAIVGTDGMVWPGGRAIVDLEDNRYQPGRSPTEDFRFYMDCLNRAAGRHVEQYPTIARRAYQLEELVEVGTYSLKNHRLDLTDSEALEEWGVPVTEWMSAE